MTNSAPAVRNGLCADYVVSTGPHDLSLFVARSGGNMSRITVIGGTGYAGAAIVAEAVKRGHEVLAISRKAPAD